MNTIALVIETAKNLTLFQWGMFFTVTLFCYYLLNLFLRHSHYPDELRYSILCTICITLTSISILVLLIWYYFDNNSTSLLGILLLLSCIYCAYIEFIYLFNIKGKSFSDSQVEPNDLITIIENEESIVFRVLGKVNLDNIVYYVLVEETQFQASNGDNTLIADIFQIDFDDNLICVDAIHIKNNDIINKVFEIYKNQNSIE